MPIYTFFMQFRGGTYISQVEADDEIRAKDTWAKQLNTKEADKPVQIKGLSRKKEEPAEAVLV